mgnify:CR=1 FL=1
MKVLPGLILLALLATFARGAQTEAEKKALEALQKTKKQHPYGKQQVIIQFPEFKPIVVDQDAIEPLLNEQLADYKIAVYSIVGGFRIGKSFLMDYCLRFMYAHVSSF